MSTYRHKPDACPSCGSLAIKPIVYGLVDDEALVLGAWGCGVFGNDGHEIAELFRAALDGQFAGMFGRVIFAVTDWSRERRFIGPFEQVFGHSGSA